MPWLNYWGYLSEIVVLISPDSGAWLDNKEYGMSIVINKGVSFTTSYSSMSFTSLDNINWQGTAKLFAVYPSSAPILLTQLIKGIDAFLLTINPADIVNIDTGVYTLEVTITNTELGYSSITTEAVTIVAADISGSDKTILSVTICKLDGTPAGREVRSLSNVLGGSVVTLAWEGVQVMATHQIADEVLGVVIGTETVTTRTNSAGYAQIPVIKGQTVTVTCPSFGKSVTVDTTGLDTIDLSSYF